jgi:hypothetical protein|tara:strand:+ start:230 stop:601 length:372 start_codon:yes stop_codon:yes gene_type:complete
MPKDSTQFNVRTNMGKYDLEANVQQIGPDILVAVQGGDLPHIGAVSGAAPTLAASVICFPGHKEDHLVKPMAEKIARETGKQVVVTAGAHWDKIDPAGIQEVLQNGELLGDLILEELDSRGND